jgi:hypothetical protein
MSMLRSLTGIVLALISFSALAADGEFYTQHNLWVFKGNHSTVNYAVDALVPVNSKVKIGKENDKKMELTLVDSGVKFTVVLAKKYTTKTMADIKARMLGDKPVELKKFGKTAQEAIKLGEVRPGMTRAEVLVARGYPPEQSTLTLDSDQWKYNQSKWNTILVQFNNGKVASIKD